jgi:hypothetical protein
MLLKSWDEKGTFDSFYFFLRVLNQSTQIYISDHNKLYKMFICSNIPAASAYGVYISQLIRYSRARDSYQDFLDRRLLLTRKLLNQWFLLVKLKSSLRTLCDRQQDLVDPLKTGGGGWSEHRWSGKVGSSCSASSTIVLL